VTDQVETVGQAINREATKRKRAIVNPETAQERN